MTPRFAIPLQRAAIALILGVASVALSGCGGAGVGSRPAAALRIVHASPDAGALDVYANGTALAYGVGFGAVSSYVGYAPGSYMLTSRQSGTAVALTSTPANLGLRAQYTLLVGNVAAGLQSLLLQDQAGPAPAGQVAVRFIDQATRLGPVDLYLVPQGGALAETLPIVAGLSFHTAAAQPAYWNVPAGVYSLQIVPGGTTPTTATVARFTGAVVTYPAGSARTVILLDRPNAALPAVQVITANDYDPPASGS